MLDKIKLILEFAAKVGWYLPAAYDEEKQGPSVTLLYSHITFCICLGFSVALAFNSNLLTATVSSMIFWVLATVFYLIRRLKTFKADLDDRSIELESADEQQSTTEKGK
jgi:hypothetical protein